MNFAPATCLAAAATSDAVTVLEIPQNFAPLRLFRRGCGILSLSVLFATATSCRHGTPAALRRPTGRNHVHAGARHPLRPPSSATASKAHGGCSRLLEHDQDQPRYSRSRVSLMLLLLRVSLPPLRTSALAPPVVAAAIGTSRGGDPAWSERSFIPATYRRDA
jgi:hypothetical protein